MILIFILLLQLNYILGCQHGEFLCKFSHDCIAASKKCDQVKDCPHGEDEHDCAVVCGEEEFKCDNLCLSKIFFCDGFYDCHDKSDEYFCPDIRKNHTCDADHFMCGEGTCIPLHYVCDGQSDCVKSEDEQNCGRVTGVELANSEIVKVDHDCPAPNYKCTDKEETCIAQRYLCDGSADCTDGSDEANCGDKLSKDECLASQGMFACQKDTDFDAHVRCLPSDQVCNGKPQCPRGDDEGDVCKSTACLKHGCGHHCMETGSGPTCYCQKGFKLGANGKSCEDVNECEEYGTCSQICKNTEGSFQCSCQEGYLLNNRSCQYIGTAQLFITMMSDKSGEIRSYDLHTKEYLGVVGPVREPVGVGFDLMHNRVFWTDANLGRAVIEYAEIQSSGSGGTTQLYLESGLEHPEDLVVDSASGLVYFSDSGKDRVVVCSVASANCSVVSDDHQQPRGLAVHSTSRLLFVTEWGRIPRIVRMNFDGSNHKSIVVTDIVWPNGITVDYTLDRIFWTDAQRDTIESADLIGGDRRLVISDVYHPFGIAVFEDNVFWSDWHDFRLFSCNKFTGKNIKMLLETPYRMNGISLHYSVFHSLSNPCKASDCSHLCIPISAADGGKDFYTCKCPEGMYLLADGINCEPEHRASAAGLLVASGNSIYSIQPQILGKLQAEPVAFETGIVAGLSSGTVNNILIAWTRTGQIFNVNAHWKTSQLVSVESDLHSIVFDHRESNLFWINTVKKTVVIMSELTKQVKTLITCEDPRALAYVNSRSVLALVDGSHLLETSLDGEKTNLLSDKVPPFANHIVYDDQEKTYYLATDERIYSTKPGLGYFKEVVTVNGGRIISLVTLGGYLYWTQEGSVHLSWLNVVRLVEEQTAFKMTLHIPSNYSKYLSASAVYGDEPQGPCAFKACSDICVTTSSSAGLCLCGDGRTLINDNLSNKCQDSGYTKTSDSVFNSPSQATLIGMFVSLGLVFVSIILLIVFFCIAKRRNFKPAEFINRSFGVSPSHVKKEADKNQEMSSIDVIKTGSRNEIENPGFDSVVLTPNKTSKPLISSAEPKVEKRGGGVLSGVINCIKSYRDPKMTEVDWSESSVAYENLVAAKGSSTPSFKRLETIEERDSAHFSSSMDYEEGASFDSANNLLVV